MTIGDSGLSRLSTDEWEKQVGDQFRTLRLRAGRDQRQLADSAGVSIGALKNLEQGKGSTLKTVAKICVALDRTDWLASIAPSPRISPLEVLRAAGRPPRSRVYRPRPADESPDEHQAGE